MTVVGTSNGGMRAQRSYLAGHTGEALHSDVFCFQLTASVFYASAEQAEGLAPAGLKALAERSHLTLDVWHPGFHSLQDYPV